MSIGKESYSCYWGLLTANQRSLFVQFESIAGFGAIIDRLGQFAEVLEPFGVSSMTQQSESADAETSEAHKTQSSKISLHDLEPSSSSPLLELQSVTLRSPDGGATLVEDLSLQVCSLPIATQFCSSLELFWDGSF